MTNNATATEATNTAKKVFNITSNSTSANLTKPEEEQKNATAVPKVVEVNVTKNTEIGNKVQQVTKAQFRNTFHAAVQNLKKALLVWILKDKKMDFEEKMGEKE